MNSTETSGSPGKKEELKFDSIQEAMDHYLYNLPITDSTHAGLLRLRETLIFQKASMRIDLEKGFEQAVAEDAFVSGQLVLIENMLSRGKRITS